MVTNEQNNWNDIFKKMAKPTGLNATGFKMNDRVFVRGEHDLMGLYGWVVGYDAHFSMVLVLINETYLIDEKFLMKVN